MLCRSAQRVLVSALACAGWTASAAAANETSPLTTTRSDGIRGHLPLGTGEKSGTRWNASLPAFCVRQWTTDDGLPANRLACLTQTHDGYIWIGTWYGL